MLRDFFSLRRTVSKDKQWPAVLAFAGTLGVMEGLLYAAGPTILVPYWLIMGTVLFLGLIGLIGGWHTIAFAPFAIATQDAFSTMAQGIAPIAQTWYCSGGPPYFPTETCWTGFGFPIWWALAFALTVVGDRVADHIVSRRTQGVP